MLEMRETWSNWCMLGVDSFSEINYRYVFICNIQCMFHFAATHIDEELDSESEKFSPFGSTFRTFDTTTYSLIATVDVKARSISDLAIDTLDTYLAVIEVNMELVSFTHIVCMKDIGP